MTRCEYPAQVTANDGSTLRIGITAQQRVDSASSIHSYNLPQISIGVPYCTKVVNVTCGNLSPFTCSSFFRDQKLIGQIQTRDLSVHATLGILNFDASPFALTWEDTKNRYAPYIVIYPGLCPAHLNSTLQDGACEATITLPCAMENETPRVFRQPAGVLNLPSPSCCGSSVLLTGSTFSSNAETTTRVRAGNSGTEQTQWISDTSIWIKTAAAAGSVASLKVAITVHNQAGSVTAAVSYDRPESFSARISGLRVGQLDLEFFCPGNMNSARPFLDFNQVLPSVLPPVLDTDALLTTENITNRAQDIDKIFVLGSGDGNLTLFARNERLHAFVDDYPCVSLKMKQMPSEINPDVAIKIEFSCQLRTPVPDWVQRARNDANLSRSMSIVIFGSKMDQPCLKIIRTGDTSATCSVLRNYSEFAISRKLAFDESKERKLAALCTASVLSLGPSENDTLPASIPVWTEIENPGCEADTSYYGRFAANEPPQRGRSLRMLAIGGDNMGVHHITPMASVGLSAAERTLWTSSSTTQCRLSAGVKTSVRTVLSTGLRPGSLSELVSYDLTQIRDAVDWKRNNVPTTGSVTVSVTGVSFGVMASTSRLRVAGSSGELTVWFSDSSVSVMAAAGASNHSVVRLTMEQRFDGSLTGTLSYDSPLDTNVKPTHNPSSGRSTITVVGFDLALFDTSAQIRMGGSACEASRWISATALQCRLSSGAGSAHSMVVTIFKQSSPYSYDDVDTRLNPISPFSFCYEAPNTINSLTKSGYGGYGSTRGGWLLTIQGTGFGKFSDAVRIIVESNLWTKENRAGVGAVKLLPGRIECKIPRASLCVGCGDSSMFDARTSGHYRTIGVHWTKEHHPEQLDQLLCLVPAGVGNTLAALMAVNDQQGENQNLFSYLRPTLKSVSSADYCSEGACGAMSQTLIYTESPSEGDVTANRLLYLRGDNFGPAKPVKSTWLGRGAAPQSLAATVQVQFGNTPCTEVKVFGGGTLITCKIAARPPGWVGCNIEHVTVVSGGQMSAEFSKHSILSLEPMPLVVPVNQNKKATAWIDGDGAGMTITFGRKPTGTAWMPLRTTMGRPFRSRPGARSDDFKMLCDTSPQPVIVDNFGGSCDTVLISMAAIPLVSDRPSTPVSAPSSLLGAGARCYWKDPSIFQVLFGANAAITVNQNPPETLRLRPGVVYTWGAPSYAADGEVLVETPATPWMLPYAPDAFEPLPYADTPKVYLEGETVVGVCDKLVMVAHVPWASGSREKGLLFTWSSEPDLTVIFSWLLNLAQ